MSRGWKVAQSVYEFSRRWMGPAFPVVRGAARYGVRVLSRIKRFELPPEQSLNYRYLTALHEPGTTLVVKKLLRPGMIAVDVGAHAGYYTRLFAKLVGPSGKVFAFEPYPASFALLERNTSRFPNVSLFNCAVSDRRMRASLYESHIHSGRHSLFPVSTEGLFVGVKNVDALPLDEVLGDQEIDLVKIDVEGAEIEVLRGAQFLARVSSRTVVIVECNPSTLAARGASEHVLFNALAEMGYKVRAIDEGTGGLTAALDVDSLVDLLEAGNKYLNLYCTRP
jgi:FkbM family methyltransferase